jgi:predicted small metal-binding protein|tara:strand:+ start:90 stop:227 length:138 start_codon:yes stop_codon:yes gene_type:complete
LVCNSPTKTEFILKIKEHVKAEHKEMELTPENVKNIKMSINEIQF